MTSCEWRICHAASVSNKRRTRPREGFGSGESKRRFRRAAI